MINFLIGALVGGTVMMIAMAAFFVTKENNNIEQIFIELDSYLKDYSTGDIDNATLLKIIDKLKERWLK